MVDFTQNYSSYHVEEHNCLAVFYDKKFPFFSDLRSPSLGYTWRPTFCRNFGLAQPSISLEITSQGYSLPHPHSFCFGELIGGGEDGKLMCWIPDSLEHQSFLKNEYQSK